MKYVTIAFPEATDISSLPMDKTGVTVGAVPGGTVSIIAHIPDPPAGVSPAHTHVVNGTVTGGTGPAV